MRGELPEVLVGRSLQILVELAAIKVLVIVEIWQRLLWDEASVLECVYLMAILGSHGGWVVGRA